MNAGLMDVDAQQPPDEEECYEGQQDVAEPLAGSTPSTEVKHAAMVMLPLERCCAIGDIGAHSLARRQRIFLWLKHSLRPVRCRGAGGAAVYACTGSPALQSAFTGLPEFRSSNRLRVERRSTVESLRTVARVSPIILSK